MSSFWQHLLACVRRRYDKFIGYYSLRSDMITVYSKTCVKRHSQKDRKLILKTIYRLMQVKSIAEFYNTFDLHFGTICHLALCLSIFELPFYTGKLIRFARASSYVADFNTRNILLTQKLLKQGYLYHKLRKTFSKFYRRYYDLISKFQVGLKSLLRQGLSEPDFYGDLVYKLKKIVGSNNFSAQFIKIISHYKKIGYNINVLQQTACLVVNPITVGNFAFLLNCMPVGRTSDSMMVPT